MRLRADTTLYVVNEQDPDGVNHMTLTSLTDAIKGGSKLSELAIFTGLEEADDHAKRTKLLRKVASLTQNLSTEELERLALTIEDKSINELLDCVMG